MNPENILKQIRDNRDAEYSLMVAMAGCLSRLVPICELVMDRYMADYAYSNEADAMNAEIAEAKRILSHQEKPVQVMAGSPERVIETMYKPVMRSG